MVLSKTGPSGFAQLNKALEQYFEDPYYSGQGVDLSTGKQFDFRLRKLSGKRMLNSVIQDNHVIAIPLHASSLTYLFICAIEDCTDISRTQHMLKIQSDIVTSF